MLPILADLFPDDSPLSVQPLGVEPNYKRVMEHYHAMENAVHNNRNEAIDHAALVLDFAIRSHDRDTCKRYLALVFRSNAYNFIRDEVKEHLVRSIEHYLQKNETPES